MWRQSDCKFLQNRGGPCDVNCVDTPRSFFAIIRTRQTRLIIQYLIPLIGNRSDLARVSDPTFVSNFVRGTYVDQTNTEVFRISATHPWRPSTEIEWKTGIMIRFGQLNRDACGAPDGRSGQRRASMRVKSLGVCNGWKPNSCPDGAVGHERTCPSRNDPARRDNSSNPAAL